MVRAERSGAKLKGQRMNDRVKKIILAYLAFIVGGSLLGIGVSLIAGLPIEGHDDAEHAPTEAPAEAPAAEHGGGH